MAALKPEGGETLLRSILGLLRKREKGGFRVFSLHAGLGGSTEPTGLYKKCYNSAFYGFITIR